MKANGPLSRHIEHELDPARLERQWSVVRQGLSTVRWRAAPGLRWSVAALGLCAALAIGYRFASGGGVATLPSGAVLGSAGEPVQIALGDGSTVELASRSQVRVERVADSRVELALLEGGANFDVAPNPSRRFRVVADAVHVDVIGTRFRVTRSRTREGLRVQVVVQRGVVEVGRSDRESASRRLLAGESWSALIGAEPPAAREPATAVAPVAAPEVAAVEQVAVGAPEPEQRARSARAELHVPTQPTAEELFSEANVARRAGRVSEAVEGYSALLQQHPRDSRAGLSAFELGRLRMDALGDSRGAVTALRQALAAPGNDAFREDALARLVLAHDALRDVDACQRAREQYLSRYPRGVHVAALSVRCAVE